MQLLVAACFLGLVSHAFSAGLHALVTSPLGGVGYVIRGPGANQYHGASIESIEALGRDYRAAGAYAHGPADATRTQDAQVAAFLARGISDYRVSGVGGGQFAVGQGGSAFFGQGPRTFVTETTTTSGGAGGVLAGQVGVAGLTHTTGGVGGATLVGQVPHVVFTGTRGVTQEGLAVAHGRGTLVGHVPGFVGVTEASRGAAHLGSVLGHTGTAIVGHFPGTVTETTRTEHTGAAVGHSAGTVVGQSPGVVISEARETVPGRGVLVGHGGATFVGQTPGVVVTETRTTGAGQGVLVGHGGATTAVGQAPGAVVTGTGAGQGLLVGRGDATLVGQAPGVVVTQTQGVREGQGVLVGHGGVVTQTTGTSTTGGLLVGQRGATVVGQAPGTIVTETSRTGQAGVLVGHVPGTVVTGTRGYGLLGVGGEGYGITTTPGTLVYRPGYGYGAAYRAAYITIPGYTVVRPGAYGVSGTRYATATAAAPGGTVLQHPIGGVLAFQPAAGIGYRIHTTVSPTYAIRHTPAHGYGLFGYGYGLGGYRYGVPTGLGYYPGAAVHTGSHFGPQAVGVSSPTTVIHQTPGDFGAGYHAVTVPGALVQTPIYGQALFGYGFGLGGHRYTIPNALGGHHAPTGLLDLGRGAAPHAIHTPGAAYRALGYHVGSAPVPVIQHYLAHAGAGNVDYGLGGVRYHAVPGASALFHQGAAYTISTRPTVTYQATAPQVATYRITSPAVTYRTISPTVTYRSYKTTYTAPVTYSVVPAINRKKK